MEEHRHHDHHPHVRRLNLTATGQISVTVEDEHMSISANLENTQKFLLSVTPTDEAGQPIALPSPASWAEDSGGTVVNLAPAADGSSCEVFSVDGAVGTASVSVVAAGAGPGDSDVSDFCVVSVLAPPPVVASLNLSAGGPEAK